jgi:hypothetical protein
MSRLSAPAPRAVGRPRTEVRPAREASPTPQERSAARDLEAIEALEREQAHAVDLAKKASAGSKSNAAATLIFSTAVVVALIWGWIERHEKHVVPATGLGYWLGIVGGLMMLSMLLYSKRKKMRGSLPIGSVKVWFQAHMVLGVLGPLLILFHSNFQLKSTNSTLAMGAMLTVVFSGIVGRYFYAKIHSGLYGQRAELSALIKDARTVKKTFGLPLANAPGIEAELKAYEAELMAHAGSGRQTLRSRMSLNRRVRASLIALQSETQALLTAKALREGWDIATLNRHKENAARGLENYFAIVRKAAGLRVYERIFSLWHLLHLPLFLLLILATIVHIIAVHVY